MYHRCAFPHELTIEHGVWTRLRDQNGQNKLSYDKREKCVALLLLELNFWSCLNIVAAPRRKALPVRWPVLMTTMAVIELGSFATASAFRPTDLKPV